jgi:hypothetical protein
MSYSMFSECAEASLPFTDRQLQLSVELYDRAHIPLAEHVELGFGQVYKFA